MLILFSGCSTSQKVVFSENFRETELDKNWEILSDKWIVSENILQGNGSQNRWSILLCKEKLPKNYILEFSSCLQSDERLLEVILNLHDTKFVGLLNCYNKLVELEDRSLLTDKDGFPDIRTVDNIDMFPEVNYIPKGECSKWTIQKTGDRLFVWIDGEEIVTLSRNNKILKNGGQFGFVTSGNVKIKDVKLTKSSLPAPENFKGKSDNRFFFLFGE